MVARARFGTLVATLVLAGCYDMERLDPGPESYYLPIDDFDDGDFAVSTEGGTTFKNWKVYPFDNAGPNASHNFDLGDGFHGEYALFGNFVFSDPGGGYFTGGSLGVADAREAVDVRRYRYLHVAARFDPGSYMLPGNTRFYAELSCRSVVPLPNASGPYYVQRVMPMTREWQEFTLDRFGEPSPEEPRIAGGPSACLAVVDGIRFTVSMSLPSGGVSGGTFMIDDVYFE